MSQRQVKFGFIGIMIFACSLFKEQFIKAKYERKEFIDGSQKGVLIRCSFKTRTHTHTHTRRYAHSFS